MRLTSHLPPWSRLPPPSVVRLTSHLPPWSRPPPADPGGEAYRVPLPPVETASLVPFPRESVKLLMELSVKACSFLNDVCYVIENEAICRLVSAHITIKEARSNIWIPPFPPVIFFKDDRKYLPCSAKIYVIKISLSVIFLHKSPKTLYS